MNIELCRKCEYFYYYNLCGIGKSATGNIFCVAIKYRKKGIKGGVWNPDFVIPENCPYILEHTLTADQK